MNRLNVREIPGIFDLLEKHEVPRVCFYHLVYAGRGSELMKEDLSHQETREAVDLIIDGPPICMAAARPRKCSQWTITPTVPTST